MLGFGNQRFQSQRFLLFAFLGQRGLKLFRLLHFLLVQQAQLAKLGFDLTLSLLHTSKFFLLASALVVESRSLRRQQLDLVLVVGDVGGGLRQLLQVGIGVQVGVSRSQLGLRRRLG